MAREVSRWGVGPCILLSALGYAGVAGGVSYLLPEVFVIWAVPYGVFVAAGIVLLVPGLVFLMAAGKAVTMAYNQDALATTGVFGVVRNPIYSAWIVFLIPGLVMFSRSWPVLLTPLVAYGVFKLLIHREDEYLKKRFGATYQQYRSQVRELLPLPRFRR